MLHVGLAAPDHLDRRRGHRLRDARRDIDVVEGERQAPAVAPAEHQVRQVDLVGVESQGAGRDGAGVQRILGARPHVGAVAVDAHRAGHRLHRGVSQERHPVVGRDHLGRFRRHLRGGAERLVERGEDCLARHVAVPAVVIDGAEGRQRLARAPVAVGNDGDRLLELHHFLDAGHPLGRRRVDRHQPAALHGSDVDGRVEHAGQREVDAVAQAAVDLRGNVEARRGRAPDGVGVGILERRIGRGGDGRRGLGQIAEGRALPRRRVGDVRTDRRAFVGADAEALGRRHEQHLARRRPRDAHAVTGAAHGHRAAGGLRAEPARQAVGAVVDGASERSRHRLARERAEHVGVGVGVEGRSLLDAHALPVRFHLLGRHHGEAGLRPLPHLAVRDQDGDEVVGSDGDPGRQLALVDRVGRDDAVAAGREGDAGHAEDEPAADEAAGADEGASRPLTHDAPPSSRRRPSGRRPPRESRAARGRTCRSGRCW